MLTTTMNSGLKGKIISLFGKIRYDVLINLDLLMQFTNHGCKNLKGP